MVNKDIKYSLGAAAVVMSILVLFINKAYFQDSYIYLVPAEVILRNPFDPYNFDLGRAGLLFYDHTHPPLTSYLIAPVIYFGDIMKEWQVNSIFVALAGLTAASLYYLGKGYVRHNLAAAILVFTAPAFLVSFSQVNADPVTLVFWVLSAALFISAVNKDSTVLFILAGLSAGLSSLASFNALGLLPLFACYLIFRRYKKINAVATFITALAVFSLWCLQNYIYYGQLQVLHAAGAGNARISLDLVGQKVFSAFSFLGGAGLFPLVYVYVFLKERRGLATLAAVLFSVVVFIFEVGYKDIGNYTLPEKAMLSIFVTLGIMAAIVMMRELIVALRRNLRSGEGAEEAFFLLWFWMVILYNILIMPFESARYLLPAYVPLAMVLVKKAESGPHGEGVWPQKVMALGIGLNMVLGLGILYADYLHADIYREFSRKVDHGRFMGGKAYFEGDWGFWFYMEKKGARRQFLYTKPLRDGDIFVRPVYTSPEPLDMGFASHLEPVGEETVRSGFPLRITNKPAQAGFYSQVWGFLPYSFSTDPLDTFSIYRYREEDLLQSDVTGNLGELYGTREFKLYFVPEAAEINGMGFYVGTYMRKNTGRLAFALGDETGRVLAKKTVGLSGVRDNSWFTIDFPPVRVSPGSTYFATLSSPDSTPGNAITFYDSGRSFKRAWLMVDGKPAVGALTFATYR